MSISLFFSLNKIYNNHHFILHNNIIMGWNSKKEGAHRVPSVNILIAFLKLTMVMLNTIQKNTKCNDK